MTAAKKAAAEAFWRFSLMLYSRPGIAAALIALQDRSGHNVNVILFGLWLAVVSGRRLDAATFARARDAIARVDGDVVQPLRDLRRALREDPEHDIANLRRRVLALEVAAERRVQARLAQIPGGGAGGVSRAALAEANLRIVLGADSDSDEGKALLKVFGD